MPRGRARALIVAQMGFFAYTATMSLLRPVRFASALGLAVAGPAGVNEIRAQYGGFFAAAALVQAAALVGWLADALALFVGAMILGGLIAGRGFATTLNRGVSGYTPAIKLLLAVDCAGLLLNLAMLQWAA